MVSIERHESSFILLISAAIIVNKSLLRSKGGLVGFVCAVYQVKAIAKFAVQTLWTIPHNFQSAATLWTVRSKRCDNDVSTHSD